jgi:hypothetical protein
VTNDANYVRAWTNDNTCQNTYPAFTSAGSNQNWLNQSIVDQSTGQPGQGAVPTFNYPSTAMSGWLCRTLEKTDPVCPNSTDPLDCPNNSSTQGQIFYSQVTPGTAPFTVYSVDGCRGPEGVPVGTVSGLATQYGGQAPTGEVAVEYHMAGGPQNVPAAHCVHPQ